MARVTFLLASHMTCHDFIFLLPVLPLPQRSKRRSCFLFSAGSVLPCLECWSIDFELSVTVMAPTFVPPLPCQVPGRGSSGAVVVRPVDSRFAIPPPPPLVRCQQGAMAACPPSRLHAGRTGWSGGVSASNIQWILRHFEGQHPCAAAKDGPRCIG